MVSYTVLRMIHLHLQQWKQNNTLYGGIIVLLFGDLMQLPPVAKGIKSAYCFQQPPKYQGESHLRQCFNFCELTINMRQGEDTTFIDILNNSLVGTLNMTQLEILDSRRLPMDETYNDIIRVFPTTKQVNEYNTIMSQELQGGPYKTP